MTQSERYCPICRERSAEPTCPVHGTPTIAASLLSTSAELSPGTVLAGRYRVERLLGKGGMGQVYEATQLSIQRAVALKTLHPRLLQDPDHLGRFYREARAASLLEGPNIVRVYDFGVDDATATPFIIMELVRGTTLRARIVATAPMGHGEAAAVAAQVCRALIEAKAAGVVHRDLKSDNILLAAGPFGAATVKVMDFGIAKLDRDLHGETGSLTVSGAILGTPRTMAPEQILGEPLDTRTDLYALGCVLHEMLTGAPPFVGDDPISVINQQLLAVPPELDPALGVPQALIRLRDSLLQKERERRPADLEVLARQLEALGVPDEVLAVGKDRVSAWMTSDTVEALREGVAPAGDVFDEATVARMERADSSSAGGAGPSSWAWRRGAAVIALAAAVCVVLVLAIPEWGTSGPDEDPRAQSGTEEKLVTSPPRVGVPELPSAAAVRAAPLIHPRRPANDEAAAGSKRLAMEANPDLPDTPREPAPASRSGKDVPARTHAVNVGATPAAHAYRNGQDLGLTPISVSLEPGSTVELVLRKDGYTPRRVVLDDATGRRVAITLLPRDPTMPDPPGPTLDPIDQEKW